MAESLTFPNRKRSPHLNPKSATVELGVTRASEARSAGLFVFASLTTGLLNYLFQVIASRELSAADFAHFNSWLANLSLLFVLGAVLQYAAVFISVARRHLRLVLLGGNFVLWLFVVRWLQQPEGLTIERGAMVVIVAVLVGGFTGQVQARSWFGTLSVAAVSTAIIKVALIWAPIWAEASLDRFAFALFAPSIFILILFTVKLWSSFPIASATSRPNWFAPLCLSLAATVIPQLDLVLLSHTEEAANFSAFARASLFYKVIFALAFTLAHWLLPRQVLGGRYQLQPLLPLLLLGSIVGSALLAFVSPYIAASVLNWSDPPNAFLIFSSCLNASLMTLLFLYIQDSAAKNDRWGMVSALVSWSAIALVQLTFKFPMQSYLHLSILLQLLVLGVLWRRRNPA